MAATRLSRKPSPAWRGDLNAALPMFEEAPAGIDRVGVLFPLKLPEPFDYRAPSAWGLEPGEHVEAPLGSRTLHGVVWRVERDCPAAGNLKAVARRIEGPPVPEVSRRFIDWAARYVCAAPGQLLKMVVRGERMLEPAPLATVYRPTGAMRGKLTDARAAVLAQAAMQPAPAAELARRAGVGAGVVKSLIETGALAPETAPAEPPFPAPDLTAGARALSAQQEAAAARLRTLVQERTFQAALLDGVTGSGKTEVYLEAAAEVLRLDPAAQVLVLLPEIALTQAVLARFEAHFAARPVEWHSAIADKARRRAWRAVAEGEARLVLGARSALFLPFQNLRLIIVDEEHDGSYKQDDGVAYQARDLAVARAKLGDAAVVLASATPSLETLVNAQQGRYAHVQLSARHGAAVLPEVELVDLREDPPEQGRWLSPKLVRAAAEALARGEQTLLYMNRRGYAPLTLCRACGHRMKAPDTESWLVEHKYSGRLVCHLTGFSMPKPKVCPQCLSPDSFVSIGPGVERVEEEAREYFPDARIAVFSSDTAQTGEEVRAIVERMAAGEIDVLVGTQIVAKGHNFPLLTVVGVVDADLGLRGGDLRAGERTYQLLSQVAGRAGRADRPGRALIQTYAPEHEAMQALAAQDRDRFMAAEAAAREGLGMPPFGRLAALIIAAPSAQGADLACAALGEAQPNAEGVDVWGPAPAPLAVIRGQHRRRFLVRCSRGVDLSGFMSTWVGRVKLASAVRLQIDIDPYGFL
jgi:primosomal protein N' (replication factor Y)